MEKPNNIIILKGKENYELWKFQYEIAVHGHNENSRKKYIVFSTSENVLRRLITCKTSDEMLIKLDELYGVDVSINKLHLQTKFYSMKCHENVIEFMDEMDNLLSKLEEVGEVISDEMAVSKILSSLPKSFQAFVTAFECSGNTTLKDLRTRLNTEWDRRQMLKNKSNEEESSEMLNKQIVDKSKIALFCNYCKKEGHFLKDCSILKIKNKNLRCFNCNSMGHISKYCKKNIEEKNEVNISAIALSVSQDQTFMYSWIVDTGATQHTSWNRNLFVTYKKCTDEENVKMANGQELKVHGIGKIILNIGNVKVTLNSVLHVPLLKFNLLAAKNFITNGINLNFGPEYCEFKRKDSVVLTAKFKLGLYFVDTKNEKLTNNFEIDTESKSDNDYVNLTLWDWHCRLGHQNLTYVKELLHNQNITYKNEEVTCESCKLGKMSRRPFNPSDSWEKEVGDLIHIDVGGPMEVSSIGNNRYYLLTRDDYSNWRTVYFMKNKSQTKEHLVSYLNLFQTQTNKSIKKIRIERDNRTIVEFKKENLVHILKYDSPNNYEEIENLSDAELWKDAIKKELEAMSRNNVWEEVPDPKCKLIDTKWVFRLKDDGNHKARLVARGCLQNIIDESEIYAPVAKLETVRVLFSVAAKRNLEIHHLDFDTAFLNSTLEEEVYIKPPTGVNVCSGNVLKLKKAMYGLKQSPKCWNKCLNSALKEIGFSKSEYDECLFFKENVMCLCYVDDILLCGPNVKVINPVKNELASKFNIKYLGLVKNFIGLKVCYERNKIKLDQTHHIEKAVEKFNLTNCREEKIPLGKDFDIQLSNNKTDKPYRNLLGTLLFIMSCCRPDISFSVNFLSRFQEQASEGHYKYLLRVLKYLKSTKEIKLIFETDCDDSLSCYVDASWAENSDRKSTSGFIVKFFGNPVMWKTRKQTTVALSSAEAEYIALSEAIREVLWLKGILGEMAVSVDVINVFEDNNSCVSMATSGNLISKRSKHLDVKLHFIKEHVDNGTIKLTKVDSNQQIADGFTKPLSYTKFKEFVKNINLY